MPLPKHTPAKAERREMKCESNSRTPSEEEQASKWVQWATDQNQPREEKTTKHDAATHFQQEHVAATIQYSLRDRHRRGRYREDPRRMAALQAGYMRDAMRRLQDDEMQDMNEKVKKHMEAQMYGASELVKTAQSAYVEPRFRNSKPSPVSTKSHLSLEQESSTTFPSHKSSNELREDENMPRPEEQVKITTTLTSEELEIIRERALALISDHEKNMSTMSTSLSKSTSTISTDDYLVSDCKTAKDTKAAFAEIQENTASEIITKSTTTLPSPKATASLVFAAPYHTTLQIPKRFKVAQELLDRLIYLDFPGVANIKIKDLMEMPSEGFWEFNDQVEGRWLEKKERELERLYGVYLGGM